MQSKIFRQFSGYIKVRSPFKSNRSEKCTVIRFWRRQNSKSWIIHKCIDHIRYIHLVCQCILETLIRKGCTYGSRLHLRGLLIMCKACNIILHDHIFDTDQKATDITSSVLYHSYFQFITRKFCKYFLDCRLLLFRICCQIDICTFRHRRYITVRLFQKIFKIQMHHQYDLVLLCLFFQ